MDPHREANRRLWDEWASIHVRSELYQLPQFRAGENKLNALEREELGTVAGDVIGLGRVERVCAIGEMQLPRGDRERHDGVDVWRGVRTIV